MKREIERALGDVPLTVETVDERIELHYAASRDACRASPRSRCSS
ncbi:MAG: hypothetical protein WD993_07890 [Thermoleophilaceae bacterium]